GVREDGGQRCGVVVDDDPRVGKRSAGVVGDDATGDEHTRRLRVAGRHHDAQQEESAGERPDQCELLDADADFLAVVFGFGACAYETNGTSAGTMSSWPAVSRAER